MQHSYSNGNGAAARPLREKVEFPINVPVAVTLDYDDGELTSGRYGDQYMYSLDRHTKIAWLDIPVRDMIKRTGAVAGDTIAICRREIKDGRKKRLQWEVERAEEEPAQPEPPPPAPPPPAPAQAKPAARATTPQPPPTEADTPAEALLTAHRTAIDVAAAAEAHAAAKGLAIRYEAADIRAMAATIYIQERRQ